MDGSHCHRPGPQTQGIKTGITMATGLYIAMDFKPTGGSGIAEQTDQLAKHMTELGENLTVLTPAIPGDAEFDRSCDYPIVRFDARIQEQGLWGRILRTDALFRSIVSNVRRLKADYMILDRWSPICGLMITLASHILRRPFFLVAHGSEFSESVPFGFSRNITARASSKVICISDYTCDMARASGVESDKLVVVHHGFDIREVDEYRYRNFVGRFPGMDSAFPEGSLTVLTVSRLIGRKRIDRIIEAMPRVVEKVPQARYVIVGDGRDADRLKRLANESPVSDSITFLGARIDDEKFECYDRCDIFAMTSDHLPGEGIESFGIVFLEANAFGKPVIGSDVGGIPEAVLHGETGLLVSDPNDIEEIANSILQLLENPDEAHRMGKNGRLRVESELNWRKSASKFLSIIHNTLITERSAAHAP